MADTAIAPTSQIPNTKNKSAANKSQVGLGNDYADFVKLLTVQLQNQDPTAPLDANQFTQQIVAFSEVQQQVNMNTNLEKLISLTQTNQLSNAASYIGKTVELDGSSAELMNGEAKFSYTLEADADRTVFTILDANGKSVYNGEGQVKKGKYNFNWNGVGDDGNSLPNGTYTIAVVAYDQDGDTVGTTTSTKGVVTGVVTENGTPMLQVGDVTVGLDKILSVNSTEFFPA